MKITTKTMLAVLAAIAAAHGVAFADGGQLTPGGLSKVTHDSNFAGNGTASSPFTATTGTFALTGGASIGGAFSVSGTTSLGVLNALSATVSGATSLSSTLQVSGATNLLSSLGVVGTVTLGDSTHDTSTGRDLAVGRNATVAGTLGVTGLTTATGGITNAGVAARTAAITPTALSADVNNYNPTGWASTAELRQDVTTSVNITGLQAATQAGQVVMIRNLNATYPITLKDENSSSSGPNQFLMPNHVDWVIPPRGVATVYYDSVDQHWIPEATGDSYDWNGRNFTTSGINTFTGTGIADAGAGGANVATEISGPMRFNVLTSPGDNLDTALMVTVGNVGSTNHSAHNELLAGWFYNLAPIDTSSAPINTYALQLKNATSKAAGSNSLTAYTLQSECQATGASTCYDYFSSTGAMRHDGDVTIGGSTSLAAITESGANTVDLSASNDLKLGSAVENFEVPGSGATTANLAIGRAQYTNGTQLTLKGTVASVPTGGITMGLDTTLSSNARGGLLIYQGSAGGFGGTHETVFARQGGADFCADGAFDDTCIADYAGSGSTNARVRFTTDSAVGTTGVSLNATGDWVLNSQLPGTNTAIRGRILVEGNGIPGATSCGSSPTVHGSDLGFTVATGSGATGCTIGFNQTWPTRAPACSVQAVNGTAAAITTLSTTQLIFTGGASTTYSVVCIGITN